MSMRGDVAVVAHQPWEKNYGEGGGALPISALSPNGIGADTLQNGRSRSPTALLCCDVAKQYWTQALASVSVDVAKVGIVVCLHSSRISARGKTRCHWDSI